jgi:excisionase family DNA binding protein
MKNAGAVQQTLSVRDVAARLGMSRAAIYAAAASGRLPCRKWRGKLLFLADDLDRFLAALPARAVTERSRARRG